MNTKSDTDDLLLAAGKELNSTYRTQDGKYRAVYCDELGRTVGVAEYDSETMASQMRCHGIIYLERADMEFKFYPKNDMWLCDKLTSARIRYTEEFEWDVRFRSDNVYGHFTCSDLAFADKVLAAYKESVHE